MKYKKLISSCFPIVLLFSVQLVRYDFKYGLSTLQNAEGFCSWDVVVGMGYGLMRGKHFLSS